MSLRRHVGGRSARGRLAADGLPMTAARLEALVSRLRAKVVAAGGHRLPLATSYGRGYRFTAHAQVLGPSAPPGA